MSHFNKKKNLYSKIFFTSSLLAAGASVIATANFSNTQNSQISLSSNDLDSSNSTRAITGTYEHTNYASFPSSMPQRFENYNLFGQTNNSNFVQTNMGILGTSTDKKTFFFTSYSGKIIWAQEFASNDIVKKFYESKNWTATDANNITIKEWALFDETAKTLAVLLGDTSNHQFVTLISLDTGFFVTSDNYTVDVTKAFQSLPSSDYTNISRATSSSLIVWKNNGVTDLQYFTFSNNTLTPVSTTTTSAATTLANKKLISFISNENQLFAYYIDASSYSNTNNTNYKYKQYLSKVSISSNAFSFSGEKSLNDYVSSSSTLDLNNFKNIAFPVVINNLKQLIFISGAGTSSYLNVFSVDNSGNLTTNKTLSLEGYTIASVTKGSDNRIFIANNKSTSGNIYLGYVDVSQNALTFSPIRQSTDTSDKQYFLLPILSYGSTQFLGLQQNNKNSINFLVNQSGNYQVSSGGMVLRKWNYRTVNNKTIWNAFGKNYLPSSFTWSTVSSYFDLSSLNATSTSFSASQVNNDNGTLSFRVTFSYVSNFSLSFNESFSVTFYINGLYDFSSNFVFSWLDSTSTVNDQNRDKIAQITQLKSSKYGNQITARDIIENFISYTIKKVDGTTITIEESMVQVTYSQNLDSITVTINIPTTDMPAGFASSGKQRQSKTYSNFLSVKDYLSSIKSSSNVSTFTKTIYPSQLTKTQVINNFLNVGSSISKNENDWSITISEADDIKGTLKLSVSYNKTSQITNFSDLPTDIQTKITQIATEVTYSSFKSISSNSGWTSMPNVTDFNGTYLPSEIWGQYKAYLNGLVNESDVILLKNINFTLTSISNLNIVCLNENSCDSDGYLDLQISIKDGSKTVVDYDGTQYTTSDGKLVFSSEFLANSGITYPYKVQWNITTANKYFYIVDRKTNSRLEASNNEYRIDIKSNSPFSSSLTDGFSSKITESDIVNLIDTQGYNYNISLETNVDNGYTKATIQLSLQDAPLFDYGINNSNFTRTIYIYNFNVPMSSVAKITIIALSSATGVLLLVVLIWFLFWKVKLIDYFKKSYNWNKKKEQDRALQQLYKKNRYFKEDLWNKKISKK
ncbi:hypothetical protein D8X55_02975 [Malacoplasma penetrans]|uniref:Lipoprotein-associated type-17 domain-containing protein n=1 Tax=Malacoplasma penetrans (strain HF-2) TaxID=272633 RepID=Q8EUS5_MALP2|nr:lipoprotein 17-related variable surface protein [Malacoplasma penetrans]RXY96654.1 hypothetical protein D8X55_02975 [Malacoplasma penetrans]BAC44637.1 conserved hypothetical protein [Malacoplasma penetrans HF-2]